MILNVGPIKDPFQSNAFVEIQFGMQKPTQRIQKLNNMLYPKAVT